MKRASDGYTSAARETRDTGFGGGLIPAGLLVGGGAAAAPPERRGPASLVTYDGQWRVAATARIDALPRSVAVVDAPWPRWATRSPWRSSFDPQRAVAVFAAADLAPRPAIRLGGAGRVRALAAGRRSPRRRGRRARRGAAHLCAAGARGPRPAPHAASSSASLRLRRRRLPPPPAPPAAASSSVTDRPRRSRTCRASGALTEAEFARAKALELGLPAP